jgi:hypothetical protein
VVLLRNAESGAQAVAAADAHGDFDSGPLTGGLWTVTWVKHAQADPDPRLSFDAAVAPGDHRRLRFTITTGTDDDAGVVELFE